VVGAGEVVLGFFVGLGLRFWAGEGGGGVSGGFAVPGFAAEVVVGGAVSLAGVVFGVGFDVFWKTAGWWWWWWRWRRKGWRWER